VSLVEEGFDLAIGVNPGPDTALIGRRLLRDEMLVVAPPGLEPPASAPEPVRAVARVRRKGAA
jgi:DNA-binding transcriptional LysR family regulator